MKASTSQPINPQWLNADNALARAIKALRNGNYQEARRWAQISASLSPEEEEPWLILAALASPKGSLIYLKQALDINPQSAHARNGMHWAIHRARTIEQSEFATDSLPRNIVAHPIPSDAYTRRRSNFTPWMIALLLIFILILAWFGSPSFSFANVPSNQVPGAQAILAKETRTPTPTATFTSTPTSTPTTTATPTFTPTSTPTSTNTPTNTPTSTPTATPKPKKKKNASSQNNPLPGRPKGVDANERWIDVNLSQQRTYAYRGNELVSSFIVSTGTWRYPTVTGTYRIYVKYRSAPMSGPGYYLPNVPYVMYFYKGYGLHGTYWHNNFGTPMSHGCINLSREDSKWLFNFASVGTVVNIHY